MSNIQRRYLVDKLTDEPVLQKNMTNNHSNEVEDLFLPQVYLLNGFSPEQEIL